MTSSDPQSLSIFQRRWFRNLLALLSLTVILVGCLGLLMYAVGESNARRIDEYRLHLGAETAAELWQTSITRRDPGLFELHDPVLLEELSSIEFKPAGNPTGNVLLSDDQLMNFLLLVRDSRAPQVPESVDFETMVPIWRKELFGLIGNCCNSGAASSDLDSPARQFSDQERWLMGVELAESLGSGGLLIQQLVRLALLEQLMERANELLSSENPHFHDRAVEALARVETPLEGVTRALQMETLMGLDLVVNGVNPWSSTFDLQCYLDLQVPFSLDPTDPVNLQRLEQGVPFYAVVTGMIVPSLSGAVTRAENSDARLLALKSAFALLSARIRGEDWIAPDGVELLESSDSLTSRIHVKGAPADCDVYLPR